MKTRVLTIVACTFLMNLYAGVERISFYFQEGSVQLTGTSLQEATYFKYYMTDHYVQLIELNAFSEGKQCAQTGAALIRDRIDYLRHFLEADGQTFTENRYPCQRVKVNFNTEGWERIDLYYFSGSRIAKPLVIPADNEEPAGDVSEVKVPKEDENEKVQERQDYMLLPIRFYGGTAEVTPDSEKYMENLLQLLKQYPGVQAHIRGHVCCGNRKGFSRRRARVVYTYLIENGIEKDRLSFKGYGNRIPLVYPEVSAEDQSRNRRVDVLLENEEWAEAVSAR